jgi:predicted AAA+ superfamily ATPase
LNEGIEMSLKPWREIAVPHEDVLKGTFQQSEFAADLSRVHERTATDEYQKPILFFQRTFITEGMRLLFDSVVKRLSGRGGDPVIQLQTAFGGGKTHTMLAVYHLAKGEVAASDLQGIAPILDAAGITELPKSKVVVLDGTRFSPSEPKIHDGTPVHTLWGELAWQLDGAEGYRKVQASDENGTAPDSSILESLLSAQQPVVVLIDELVAYVRQFEEGKSYKGGTFDSNLTFIQNLTQALKAVPKAVLLISVPESKESEAGSGRGRKAMDILGGVLDQRASKAQKSLEKTVGRVHALWKPVATEEAFEIVRRRLFSKISDGNQAESVCRAYSDYYVANADDFPHETQESRYFDRLMAAYPIHPEVFDRLYEDWSSLDNFQRTRGVLKLMAKVIYRLWKDGNNDPLIMPGSLPLYDADSRNEAIYYLPQGWDPVLEGDIDGDRAETTEIEVSDTRFGSVQACRRAARAIFLGSAPSTTANQSVRGVEAERVHLGVAQPGQQVGLYKDALRRLADRLHYLNSANNRYWFDTRPNLRREMEERKRRFRKEEKILPTIRDRVQGSLAHGVFAGAHVFTASSDIPDDWRLRLVVLPPQAAFSRASQSAAMKFATEILSNRGDQPRTKQNRLVFLAADADVVSRLEDQVCSLLAWQSIVDDIKELTLNLDQIQARQAQKNLESASETVKRTVRETYKWLLTPMQEPQAKGISEVKWESFPVNPGAANLTQEIEHVLEENELLISEWAPVHLKAILKTWFWKDGTKDVSAVDVWQKSCQYLYLPRLKDDMVFRTTLMSGAGSRDFFGLAQGKDGDKYAGFTFGQSTLIMLDSCLLIEPEIAAAYAEQQKAAQAPVEPAAPLVLEPSSLAFPSAQPGAAKTAPALATPQSKNRRFYGSVELDPIVAKKQFADIVDEVLLQFTAKPGVTVKIVIDIQAQAQSGFDDSVQRAVKENCKVLRFRSSEFEPGD